MNNEITPKRLNAEELALTFKNIFKDIFKYFPSKLIGLIGNAIVIPIYTNLLTTEQYGIYTLSVAVLSFICIIFSDWVGLSGLRFFKQHEMQKDIQKYLSTVIGLLTGNLIVMFITAILFRHWFYSFFKISPKIFLFILLLIIPVAIRALFFQILRAQIKPWAFTISTILNQFLTIILSVFFIKAFHWGAYAMLMGMALSISLIDVILIFQSNIKEYFEFSKPKLNILSSLFRYGIPLSITSISLWAITQSNRLILNRISGFNEVGYLGVAYGMTFAILDTLFVVITVAAYPRIINLFEEHVDVRPIISRLTGYYVLISLPVIVVYSLYAEQIVNFMANSKFHDAYILIPYLSFSVFFYSLTEYTTMQYLLSKKTYLNTIIRVISAIIGLGLNIVLIIKMGLVGLGIATLASNIFCFLLSIIINVKNLEWQVPYRKLTQIALAFIPALIFYYYVLKDVNWNIFIETGLILIIYYAVYMLIIKLDKHANA
jgi:O-antigen/teichoic acid export membrane protein